MVRVTGTAYQCGSNLSGSGFVVAEDRVVTNAHVVAGVTEPIIEAPGQPALAGRVVAFDRENDLALIAVSGLLTPPLAIADAAAGSDVAVAGYPFGGPLELRPAQVMSVEPITIEESGRTSTREIMTLAADVDHGDSGDRCSPERARSAASCSRSPTRSTTWGTRSPSRRSRRSPQQAPALEAQVDSGSCAG